MTMSICYKACSYTKYIRMVQDNHQVSSYTRIISRKIQSNIQYTKLNARKKQNKVNKKQKKLVIIFLNIIIIILAVINI